jgi:hypothetical protein
VCRALLQDPAIFLLLVRIDEELAASARATGRACRGLLHSARYPRTPRGCPAGVREHFRSRFIFSVPVASDAPRRCRCGSWPGERLSAALPAVSS